MDLVRNTAWKTERGEMQGDARPPLSHGWAPEFYNINTCKDIIFFSLTTFGLYALKKLYFIYFTVGVVMRNYLDKLAHSFSILYRFYKNHDIRE